LANGARKYWLVYKHWPISLDKHVNGILGVLAVPYPNNPTDIEQYLLNIPMLFRALKAWEEELEEYATSKDLLGHIALATPIVN
jgi:hypothetical protein